MRRSRSAASAASSTTPPRAMLVSVAVGFISASSAAPMAWCEAGEYGTTRIRWSASRSSSAFVDVARVVQPASTSAGSRVRL